MYTLYMFKKSNKWALRFQEAPGDDVPTPDNVLATPLGPGGASFYMLAGFPWPITGAVPQIAINRPDALERYRFFFWHSSLGQSRITWVSAANYILASLVAAGVSVEWD